MHTQGHGGGLAAGVFPYIAQRAIKKFICRISTSVVHRLPKPRRRVRFPYPAPKKNTILWMVFFVDIGVPQRTRGSTTASLGCDFVFTNWECDPSCLSAYEMPSIRMAFQRVEKVFSPRCLSSFLNFSSSENCLIERERGFLPISLYPRCSIAGLRFIVFLTASNAIHKDGISSLKYGPRGGLRRFARPTHRTSHIDLADCTKSCIRLCVFRGRIVFL